VSPLLHVTRGLSWRWFIRRWHADREFYAWHDQQARAGVSIGVGWWRVQAALLRPGGRT
jgi:hypothetical protein